MVAAAGAAQAAGPPRFTDGSVTKLVPASTTDEGQVALAFHETGLPPRALVHYSFTARMRGIYVGPWQHVTARGSGKDKVVVLRRDHGQVVAQMSRTFTARADKNGVVSGANLTPPVFTPPASAPLLYWTSIWHINLRDTDNGLQNRFYLKHRYRNVCNKDGKPGTCTGVVVT